MVLGLKLMLVPLGSPVADKFTALLNPSVTVVEMVPVTCPAGAALTAFGAVKVNDGGSVAVTVRATEAF